MAEGTQFPQFIVLREDPGNAQTYDQFVRNVEAAGRRATDSFGRSMAGVRDTIAEALAIPRNATGSLDLNIQQLREMERQQEAVARATREYANAMRDASVASGEVSRERVAEIRAAMEAARIREQELAQLRAEITLRSAVQDQLNKSRSAVQLVTGSIGNLIDVERAAAEGAKILEIAHRNTDLAIGRTTKSARESAQTFELMFQAMEARSSVNGQNFFNTALGIDQVAKSARASATVFEEMFAAEEKAAQAARDHATAAAQLRAQLDPTVRMQVRFDAEMARADSLLEAGAISQQEYGQAVAFARQQLADNYQALFRQEAAVGRGTDAWGIHTNSLRGSRQAMVQTGQQLQDIAISLYGGQRATTVFAQQIPQLTFALTSLEGSTNKTLAKIGAMATTLSGPLSIAVVGVSALLGALIDHLFNSEDAASGSRKAHLSLSDALDKARIATDSSRQALEEYNAEQDRNRKNTEDMVQINLASAESRLKDAIATRQQLQAELELAQQRAKSASKGLSGEDAKFARLGGAVSVDIAKGRLDANQAGIDLLNKTIGNLRIENANRNAAGAADGATGIRNSYTDRRNALEREYNDLREKGLLTDKKAAEYQAKRTKLLKDEAAALEAYSAAHRKVSGFGGSRDLADFGAPVTGGRISSGYGTRVAPTKGASTNHLGLDYAVPVGTPVYATQSGTIKSASWFGGYGNQIQLSHGGGTESRYSHLSRFAVGSGDSVNKGDLIGYSGKTGTVTGPHLHYEVLVNGTKVDPSKGKFPIDAAAVADEAQKAADALRDFGERSAEKIARINEAFDEQPRLIDRANQATRELDVTIADLKAKNKDGIFDQQIKDAEAAKVTIQDALVRPFREMREESEKRITIQRLLTAGREDEAEALDKIWSLERVVGSESEIRAKAAKLAAEGRKEEADQLNRMADMWPQQRNAIRQQVIEERLVTEELQRRQDIINSYLDATRSVKQELVSIFSGEGSFANLGKIFRNLQGQAIVEKLFGNAFRDFDKWVKGQSGLSDSVEYFEEQTTVAGDAAANFAATVNAAASAIRNPVISGISGKIGSTASSIAALIGANDNGFADIVVEGKKQQDKNTLTALTPERYFAELSKTIVGPMLDGFDAIFGVKFFSKLSGTFAGAMNGYLTGGPAGGVLGAARGLMFDYGKDIFGEKLSDTILSGLERGIKGTQTGTMIAGLGNAFGIKLSTTGSQIGGALGSLTGLPGGDIIGSIGGGLIGNLFKSIFGKRPRGAAEVSNTSVYGHTNDTALTESISGWGGQVQDAIKSIADALGASVGNYSIGLGRYKDYYQVSSQAGDPRLGNSYFGRDSRNAVYDGLDAEAAMSAAIGAVLAQGAIKGISAASQKILSSAASKDLQAAIEKAVLIESIPKRLKRLTDPVGAAIDDLNVEFEKMIAALKEGGATTQQFADAQKLYELERAAAIEQASASVSSSLRALLDDLTVGNDALALRDRRAAALAAYDPLRARVQAGDASAYNDFADAARALLDIERQMYGSQSGYFSRLDEVTGLTRTALATQDALLSGATGADSPFAANDNVTTSLDAQTGVLENGFDNLSDLLTAINLNLGTIGSLIQLNGLGGTSLLENNMVVNY